MTFSQLPFIGFVVIFVMLGGIVLLIGGFVLRWCMRVE